MTAPSLKIKKLIADNLVRIKSFEDAKESLLKRQQQLGSELDETHDKLSEAVKDIDAQIGALKQKREEIVTPFIESINSIESQQQDIRYTLHKGEKLSSLQIKLEKIQEIIKFIDDGYQIIYAEKWNDLVKLGGWDRSNFRPEGWYTIDIFVKGTSIYCQSNVAKKPRKLFDMTDTFRWTVKLSKGLKPVENISNGGQCRDCPKCGKSMLVTKFCPVCREEDFDSKKPVEFKCRACGHIEDVRAEDKHTLVDEPNIVTVTL